MKKIYIVPNFVTTLGMLSGFYSIIASFNYDFIPAAWGIMAAGVFDMLDGRIARLAKATSSFGVEYDSLSDLISFGVAPSILVFSWGLDSFERYGWIVSFLFLACGALRLARFNISTSSLPNAFFQGLPIPIAAGVLTTFVLFNEKTHWPETASEPVTRYFVLVLTLVLASLMVSSIAFPSFKEINWRSRTSSGYVLLLVTGIALIAIHPEVASFLLVFAYVVVSLLWNFYRILRRKRLG